MHKIVKEQQVMGKLRNFQCWIEYVSYCAATVSHSNPIRSGTREDAVNPVSGRLNPTGSTYGTLELVWGKVIIDLTCKRVRKTCEKVRSNAGRSENRH